MNLREKLVGLTIRGTAAPAFRATEQGELYRGYGDGLSRAFELALTPAIFAAMGFGLDHWLGILPVLTIVFFLVAVAGVFVRFWYAYDASMREEEARAPWARHSNDSAIWAPRSVEAPQ